MDAKFTLDQSKLEDLVLRGLKEELSNAMRSQWGTGQKLRNMVDETIGRNVKVIEAHVQTAVVNAINSPEFEAMCRAAILGGMKDKFSGAFEGVLRAAGKEAAKNKLLAQGVAERLSETIIPGATP